MRLLYAVEGFRLRRAQNFAGRRRAGGAPSVMVRNADEDRAEVRIYDYIDSWFGISADEFVSQLNAITAPAIDLRINSGGGDVFDAYAIYHALQRFPGTVDVHIDGLAASAASFIAMAGDTIEAGDPSRVMIHDAAGFAYGNTAVMAEMGQLLDELSNDIAGIYARKTGTDTATWRDAMRAETWYSAQGAVDAKLVDRIAGDDQAAETVAQAVPAAEDAASRRVRAAARSHIVRARARQALEGGTRQ